MGDDDGRLTRPQLKTAQSKVAPDTTAWCVLCEEQELSTLNCNLFNMLKSSVITPKSTKIRSERESAITGTNEKWNNQAPLKSNLNFPININLFPLCLYFDLLCLSYNEIIPSVINQRAPLITIVSAVPLSSISASPSKFIYLRNDYSCICTSTTLPLNEWMNA